MKYFKMESKGIFKTVIRNGRLFVQEVKITPAILFKDILEDSPEKSSEKEMNKSSDKMSAKKNLQLPSDDEKMKESTRQFTPVHASRPSCYSNPRLFPDQLSLYSAEKCPETLFVHPSCSNMKPAPGKRKLFTETMVDKPKKRNHKSKRSVKRKLHADLEEARRSKDIQQITTGYSVNKATFYGVNKKKKLIKK